MIIRIPVKDKTIKINSPTGAVPVQVEHISTKDKEEHPLAIYNVNLSWHVICNQYEMEELSRYQAVKPHEYADHRHQLFDDLKWPKHSRWQGGWGPEPMYYDSEYDIAREGRLCIVYATDKRAAEIRTWVQNQMFNIAPGNE